MIRKLIKFISVILILPTIAALTLVVFAHTVLEWSWKDKHVSYFVLFKRNFYQILKPQPHFWTVYGLAFVVEILLIALYLQ